MEKRYGDVKTQKVSEQSRGDTLAQEINIGPKIKQTIPYNAT